MKKFYSLIFIFLVSLFVVGCGENAGGGFSEGEPISNISDEVQIALGADPKKIDTDGDGLTDEFEIQYSYPYHKPDNNDTNGDGISDADEDYDNDGLTALEEQEGKSNPLLADSDLDGLSDKDEIQIHKTNPLKKDTDDDNLSDAFEISVGLNPLKKDSDGNGIIDSKEQIKQKIELNTDSKNSFSVKISGEGDLSKKILITEKSNLNPNFTNIASQVSKTYSLKIANNVEDYIIKFKIDSSKVSDINNLKLFVFDNDLNFWIPVQTTDKAIIDNGDGTLSFSSTVINEISSSSKSLKIEKETQYLEKEVSYLIATDGFLSGSGITTSRVCIPSDEVNKDSDIVFVIDSSGSMEDNDPSNIRISASKDFLNAFSDANGDKIGDRGAVVDFDSGATLSQSLTQDKTLLETALNRIDSNGGTNIGAGVNLAINELLNADNFDKNHKVIILLTDGDGSYDASLTQKAKDNNIRILTIGLSSNVDNQLLFDIANETGGVYKQINSSSDLAEVFKNFEKTLGDDGSDSDGDGLSDCAEYLGMFLNNGKKIITDPNNPDTDGDGIPDGEEIYKASHSKADLEARAKAILKKYNESGMYITDSDKDTFETILKYGLYSVKSYPNKIDSDDDGLKDGDEILYNTKLFNSDSDDDGLSDSEEVEFSLNPNNKDSDGDTYEDLFEFNAMIHSDSEYDPWTYTVIEPWYTVFPEFLGGFFIGDYSCEDYEEGSLTCTSGSITAGFVIWGDIVDIIYDIDRDNYGYLALDIFGIVPAWGDGAKVGKKIANFYLKVGKDSIKGKRALKLAAKKIDDSEEFIKFLEKSEGLELVTKLQKHTDGKTLHLLARGGKMSMKELSNMLDGASKINKIDKSSSFVDVTKFGTDAGFVDGFFMGKKGWKLAEDYMRGLDGVSDFKKALKTFSGKIRYPDYWNPSKKIMKEVKTGYQSNKKILEQIKRDSELLANGTVRKDGLSWHFFPSGRSNSIGASPQILKALEDANIPYFIHLP